MTSIHYIIQSTLIVLKISMCIFNVILSLQELRFFSVAIRSICQHYAWSDLNTLLFFLCPIHVPLLPGRDGFYELVVVCGFIIFVCVGCEWYGEETQFLLAAYSTAVTVCLVTPVGFALLQKLSLGTQVGQGKVLSARTAGF